MKKYIVFIMLYFGVSVFAQQVTRYVDYDRILGNYFQKLNYYGVIYDLSEDKFYRTGTLKDVATGTKPSEQLLTVQSQMRRCVINDAGVVQYFLDENNSALKATGGASTLTGAHGQVMVQVKKFWYKYSTSGDQKEWDISPTAIDGFSVHPAFVDSGGVEVDYVYIGAYQAVLWDSGTSGYIDGDGTSQYTSGDKLSSVAGLRPLTTTIRANFRTAATARGTGWHQMSAEIWSMIQLLFVTEYASFRSQAMISEGNTKFSSFVFATCIDSTGKSNALGNFSGGQSTTSGNMGDYMSYRGVEDLYGNLWQIIDGININNNGTNSLLYVANDYRAFVTDASTNYSLVGNLAAADGYVKSIINTNLGFYPLTVGGASTTYLMDYYYTEFDTAPSGGWRAWQGGGAAHHGTAAGVFDNNSANASSTSVSYIGGRLCFAGN